MEACGNCKFWKQYGDPDNIDGDCRRFPPKQLGFGIPYYELDGDHFGQPVSSSGDWCGEFVAKE